MSTKYSNQDCDVANPFQDITSTSLKAMDGRPYTTLSHNYICTTLSFKSPANTTTFIIIFSSIYFRKFSLASSGSAFHFSSLLAVSRQSLNYSYNKYVCNSCKLCLRARFILVLREEAHIPVLAL